MSSSDYNRSLEILISTINQILNRFQQQPIRDISLRHIFYLNVLSSVLDIVNSWVQINFGNNISSDNQQSLNKLISDIQKDLLGLAEWISGNQGGFRSIPQDNNSVNINDRIYKI
jgi:hypothetical protein